MADVHPAAPGSLGHDVPDSVKADTTPSHHQHHAHLPEISTATPMESQNVPTLKDANTDRTSSRAASQPMSKQASSSSHVDSTKDDSLVGAAGYGTRSRNRPQGSRPNYAEDQDVDLEVSSIRQRERRSASSESNPRSRAPSEGARPLTTTLRLTTGTPNGASKSANSASLSDRQGADSATDSNGEKKKRKPERSAVPKPAVSGANHANPKEGIPGTFHFTAASNSSVDIPPAKKRKTLDGLITNSSFSARRKSSMSGSKHGHRATALVSFDNTRAILKHGKLTADDGTVYARDDCIYLICEPPGDPYYLARIMDFRTANPNDPRSPVVSILVNWFYRPRDISRYSSDPRFLFASMQSDQSPLSSLRGKCFIKHRSEIQDLDEYRRVRDSFWFMQLYDRYSHRPYEMVPANTIINVPPNVKKAIDDHWKFLVLEPARQRELTSAVKLCKRCGLYAAPEKSVDCGVCRETYHMSCVNPPLSKKPSRGFAWSCAPCSRAQERRLEERHTTNVASDRKREDAMDVDEPEVEQPSGITTPMPEIPETDSLPEQLPEQAEVAKSNMWPWRYLGLHCKVDDVLQYDDRAIYPRASSRLGNRHQADLREWYGRAVELIPSTSATKKFKGFGKGRDPKVPKENQPHWQQTKAAQKTRPGWVQEEPQGYVARGEDFEADNPRCTATPLFVKPEITTPSGFAAVNAKQPGSDKSIDEYMDKARQLGKDWGLVTTSKKGDPQISSNYLDQALKLLNKHKFDTNVAIKALHEQHSNAVLKQPEFNETELKKFEDGVAKHGSDLRSVRKHVKTKTHGEIVRFYYTWKFTRKGDEIWGGNTGRKGVKRRAEASWMDIADEEDDSAFDNDKALTRKRRFHCKHCATRSSRQWRRAPNVAPGATVLADPKGGKEKANQLVVALCLRCAVLWRRYAMYWADPDETARSFVQMGGRQWKKRQEEDFLREVILANELAGVPTTGASAAAAANMGIELIVPIEAAKKKTHQPSREHEPTPPAALVADGQKKKPAPPPAPPPPPKEPTPPPVPNPPIKRALPCAVCRYVDTPAKDQRLECMSCRLNVHKSCYGITEAVNSSHWVCDTCINDKKQQHLLRYECAACPVADRPVEFYEPPKVSHKKKTDREREKERQEKLLAQAETDAYFRSQRKRGRPQYPREALKLTENSNWMHLVCATWLPEIKFSNASKFQRAEGMAALINTPRTEQVCKLCQKEEKAVVACHQCHAPFHVMCAHDAGYTFGFDITPVKGSRKDAFNTVTVGAETGAMSAAIWCKEHSPKTIIHDMTEVVDPETGRTALQLFTQTFKQADLTLTGTARKANLLTQSTKLPILSAATPTTGRRISSMTNGVKPEETSTKITQEEQEQRAADQKCQTCGCEASLKWHKIDEDTDMVNGDTETHKSPWQCHKCYMLDQKRSRSPSAEKPAEVVSKPLDEEPDLFRRKRPAWSGGDTGNMAYLQHFADELKKTTIVLTNPKFGGLHVFKGEGLNLDLDSDPRSAFRLIIYQASLKCGYDQERDVIITEDGSWVTFPKSMMQALVKMIVAGSREGHWRVVSAREVPCKLMANVYVPPDPNHVTTSAPFPPHLAPPSFNGPRLDTVGAYFRPQPPAGTMPGPSNGHSSPLTPGGPPRPLSNTVSRHGVPQVVPQPVPPHYQGPNCINTPLVTAPPGYQPAMPRPHLQQTSQPAPSPPAAQATQPPSSRITPTPAAPTTNGTPGPTRQRENSVTSASNSPSVHNLLRP